MAINYSRVNWDTTKYVNPSNMNQMDEGIKDACDGVDNLNIEVDEKIGDISTLPDPASDLCTNISEVNSKLDELVKTVTITLRTSAAGTIDIHRYGKMQFVDRTNKDSSYYIVRYNDTGYGLFGYAPPHAPYEGEVEVTVKYIE
mgnify:CR=1 FL=1